MILTVDNQILWLCIAKMKPALQEQLMTDKVILNNGAYLERRNGEKIGGKKTK